MKKWMTLILILVCLLNLAACNSAEDVDDTQPDPLVAGQQETPHSCTPFSLYLDEKSFAPGMTQSDLISQAEAYSYSGKAAIEHVPGIFWDGPSGGGLDMDGELFGFSNSFTASEDNTYADYSNRFYTTVPLEGLQLPFRISFADTLETTLEKIGIDADVVESAETRGGTVTLCEEENSTLQLTAFALPDGLSGMTDHPNGAQYAYELKYTQTYETVRPDGRQTNVTRLVALSFDAGSSQLGLFEMSVRETYPIEVETQDLSEIPGAVIHLVEIRDMTKEEDIACASALEKFWEDETNEYYFGCVKSQYVYAMDSTGKCFDIITALNQGLATIEDLDYFHIGYITKPK